MYKSINKNIKGIVYILYFFFLEYIYIKLPANLCQLWPQQCSKRPVKIKQLFSTAWKPASSLVLHVTSIVAFLGGVMLRV